MKTKKERITKIIKHLNEIDPYFNITQLARLLGVSRRTIYRFIDQLLIDNK